MNKEKIESELNNKKIVMLDRLNKVIKTNDNLTKEEIIDYVFRDIKPHTTKSMTDINGKIDILNNSENKENLDDSKNNQDIKKEIKDINEDEKEKDKEENNKKEDNNINNQKNEENKNDKEKS